MSNAIICINKRFAVKNSGISCELSKKTNQHAQNCFKVARYDDSYNCIFGKLIRTYGLVVNAILSESSNMGLIPAG